MRLFKVLLALLFLLAPAHGAWSGGEEAPSAVVEEAAHDFGQIDTDRTYEHGFVVRNLGSGELEILEVVVG
ncbi:MAG: hypothetical protein ACLGPL_06700 [Acidobacteriota bacterium]